MRTETQSALPPQNVSVEALLRAGVRLLTGRSDSPRLDAEVLLAWALDCNRAALFAGRETSVAASAASQFLAAVRDRQAGRPVAQIVGRREFWTLELRVTAAVLTPRPETELLVERALARLPVAAGSRVLDLGTGSGAVALAIASERPAATVLATDASVAALQVARDNAAANQLERVSFAAGDWFEPVAGQRFTLVVSNPPYIADPEWDDTGPELAFEPRAALAAGVDGLDAIRYIVAGAAAHLEHGGWLMLEHGATQGPAVRALMTAAGFTAVSTSVDLAGLPRVTEGRRP